MTTIGPLSPFGLHSMSRSRTLILAKYAAVALFKVIECASL